MAKRRYDHDDLLWLAECVAEAEARLAEAEQAFTAEALAVHIRATATTRDQAFVEVADTESIDEFVAAAAPLTGQAAGQWWYQQAKLPGAGRGNRASAEICKKAGAACRKAYRDAPADT